MTLAPIPAAETAYTSTPRTDDRLTVHPAAQHILGCSHWWRRQGTASPKLKKADGTRLCATSDNRTSRCGSDGIPRVAAKHIYNRRKGPGKGGPGTGLTPVRRGTTRGPAGGVAQGVRTAAAPWPEEPVRDPDGPALHPPHPNSSRPQREPAERRTGPRWKAPRRSAASTMANVECSPRARQRPQAGPSLARPARTDTRATTQHAANWRRRTRPFEAHQQTGTKGYTRQSRQGTKLLADDRPQEASAPTAEPRKPAIRHGSGYQGD